MAENKNYKLANLERYKKSSEREKFLTQAGKKSKLEYFRSVCREFAGKDDKILDIGGGAGNYTDVLREQGITSKIYAVDISESVLKERNEQDICAVGDMENLPYENDFFDRTMFFGSLHHVKDTLKALSEAKRVTKNGGFIFLAEPVSLKMLLRGEKIESTSDEAEFRFSIKHLIECLEKIDVKIKKISYLGFLKRFYKGGANIGLLNFLSMIERFTNKIPLIKPMLGLFANNVIILAKVEK